MKTLLFITVVAVIYLGAVRLGFARDSVHSPDDDWVIAQIYQYRTLATRYDSSVVRCTFGEICIPNYLGSDSLHIQWKHSFPEPGLDSSAWHINSLLESEPFVLTDSTELSMLHLITLLTEDDNALYSVPDTTAWTMELWNKQSGVKIATIDSVGICKATYIAAGAFPATFGFIGQNTFECLTISLGAYAMQNIDTVFLVLRMKNWDADGEAHCTVFDNFNYNAKFSQTMGWGKRKAASSNVITPQEVELTVFPNPAVGRSASVRLSVEREQFLTVSMFSSDGRSIGTLFSGVLTSGIRVLPVHPSQYGVGIY